MIGVVSLALAVSGAAAPLDGQHDFDFEFGKWKTHVSRLQHPLTGSKSWVEYDGTTVVRKVWGGRAIWWSWMLPGPRGTWSCCRYDSTTLNRTSGA